MTDFLQAHPNGQVLCMDEMSLYLQATTTHVWARRGDTPVVRVSPQRDHIHFFGALNVRSGHQHALPSVDLSSESSAAFLTEILRAYPTQPILLFLDRAPWHKGQAVKQLLAAHPRLATHFFPPACPDLNPQEHVWSRARAVVSHNHNFASFAHLKQAFLNFLSTTYFHFDWLSSYAPPLSLLSSAI